MTSTPTKPLPDANANGRAGSAIVQSEGSPLKGDAGSSPARAADFSGCICTVPPGDEDLKCDGCEPTVTERLTARGLRLGDRVGTTKHDIVDGAGLVVFTGDAGQVAEWLDATPAWTFDGYTLAGPRDSYRVVVHCGVGEEWSIRRDAGEYVSPPDAALEVMRAWFRAHPTRCGSCVWCVPQTYRVIGGVSR